MKNAFKTIFVVLVIIMTILPFVTTFNEFLTRIVEKSALYKVIEVYLVPYEVRLIRTIVGFFGVETFPNTIVVIKDGVNMGTYLSWNCLGWQSFVILLISLRTGLEGKFTLSSKIMTLLFGVAGTFLINIFRISLVLIFLFYFGRTPSAIFHDYAGVFISILWLFFYWWFSYSYILEEKIRVDKNPQKPTVIQDKAVKS